MSSRERVCEQAETKGCTRLRHSAVGAHFRPCCTAHAHYTASNTTCSCFINTLLQPKHDSRCKLMMIEGSRAGLGVGKVRLQSCSQQDKQMIKLIPFVFSLFMYCCLLFHVLCRNDMLYLPLSLLILHSSSPCV